MTPLRARLLEARRRLGVPWEVLERDYLISWILAGISSREVLRKTLVFKGGTALKKCYFGEYRFSEDLDFSALDGAPAGNPLEEAVRQACSAAAELLGEYAPVEIACERYVERAPHPEGQEAFTVRARLPWHRRPQTRIMLEITMDEEVVLSPLRRAVLHDYGEPFQVEVLVYTLEEIAAEKLRAILQYVERLQRRGWSRSRARDYYDLWRIFSAYRSRLNLGGFVELLAAKCAVRDVSFNSASDFFDPAVLGHVERTWQDWLGPLVADLPAFPKVIRELRAHLRPLLGSP